MQKPSLPKGTRDFGPAEVQKRKYILNTIEAVFKKYGFMPIETPSMENLSTLEGKYGDEGDKLLFRVLNSGNPFAELSEVDRLSLTALLKYEIKADLKNIFKHPNPGEASLEGLNHFFKEADSKADDYLENRKKTVASDLTKLARKTTEKGLRYDLTVPFARYVVMNRNNITFPFKRYQMQPVWRADRPQKGRYREFWQCDADVVGSDSLLNEVDLVQIYDEAFRELGIGNYELRINNRKLLSGIAEVVKSKDHLGTISVAIDKMDKIGEDGVKKELSEQGFSDGELATLFSIISIKGDNTSILEEMQEKLQSSEEGLKGIAELQFVLEKTNGSGVNIKVDFSLARGLSYYTGCIFEVAATEGSLRSSIGGGGRYDNLTGIFGMPGISGVGISFGLDRIYDVMDELKLFPAGLNITSTQILFCYFDEATQAVAIAAAKRLRDEQIPAEVYPDIPGNKKPLEKPLKYATALGIPYAAVVRSPGEIMLKDLHADAGDTNEISCDIEQIILKLKK